MKARMNWRLLLLLQLDLALVFLTRANGFPTVPQKYFVFGLPFSGVDYVQRLLDAAHFGPSTLSDCSITKSTRIEPDTNQSSIMTSWKYEPFGWKEMKKLSSCSANETLFILVTKDPFAWLSSVARRRFKTKKVFRMHMKALVRAKWEHSTKAFEHAKTMAKPRNYRSILSRRTITMQSHFAFLSRTEHHAIVRYEDLLTDLSGTMKSILRGRGINFGNTTFVDVSTTKAELTDGRGYTQQLQVPFENHKFYIDREYLSLFDEKTRDRVCNGLNKRLEKKIGYNLASIAEESKRVKKGERNVKGLILSLWRLSMNILWWVVVPTVTFIVLFAVLVLWLKIEAFSSAATRIQQEASEMTRNGKETFPSTEETANLLVNPPTMDSIVVTHDFLQNTSSSRESVDNSNSSPLVETLEADHKEGYPARRFRNQKLIHRGLKNRGESVYN